jgi:hypothetical protein
MDEQRHNDRDSARHRIRRPSKADKTFDGAGVFSSMPGRIGKIFSTTTHS